MRFEYISQDQFIVTSVVRMILAATPESGAEESYNTAIGCAVDEVVKHNMRQLSQRQDGIKMWTDLLDTAMQRSAEQLQRELNRHRLAFNFKPYLEHARETLEGASKEMTGLNRKLIESRQRKRIGEKKPLALEGQHIRYEMSELGLLGAIEGLLTTPAVGVSSLNIERVRDVFKTEGEWFPFEVLIEDLMFVIDDDGSVFISTENFPSEALSRARSMLHRLAEVLYS